MNAIANLCGIRSVALLSRYDAAARATLVHRFQTPLAAASGRWISEKERDDEIEVMFVSINQNTGLNFQGSCSHMVFMSPPPSDATRCQCCGRIVRIGQEHSCIIAEVYDPQSFNLRTFIKAMKQAIPNLVSMLNEQELSRAFALDGNTVEDDSVPLPMDRVDLDSFMVLPDKRIIQKNDPNVSASQLNEAQPLTKEELMYRIYDTINAKNFEAVKDKDDVMQFSELDTVVRMPPSVSNTPQRFPGIRGQRTITAEDAAQTLSGLDGVGSLEQRFRELSMPVEVDALPGVRFPELVRKAKIAKDKLKRSADDAELSNTAAKRQRMESETFGVAMNTHGYSPLYDIDKNKGRKFNKQKPIDPHAVKPPEIKLEWEDMDLRDAFSGVDQE